MKNPLLIITMLLTVLLTSGCGGKGGERGATTDVAAPQTTTTKEDKTTKPSATTMSAMAAIAEGWCDKNIAVKTAEDEPDVMTLIKAFHAVWPTDVVDSLIVRVGDKRFVSEDTSDAAAGSCHVYVDCDDFNCASFDHGDTGDQSMDARVYRRENGHTLFAIRLEQNNPEQKLFCCFYDYDPKTRVMTPEKEPYATLQRKWKDSSLEYSLGEYYDQTIVVLETSPKGDESIFHQFVFDGMKHYYQSSDDTAYEDTEGEDSKDWSAALPSTAVRKDEKVDWELYVNLDVAASEDHPNQWSVWMVNKQTGGTRCLFQTNNDAAPKWEEMKDGNAIEVALEDISAGDCDVAKLVPGDPYKVYVEGCPDGRNVWSYLYNVRTGRIMQFPASEGLIELDWRNDRITLSAYRYYPEGGRYSVKKDFTLDGKFLKEEKLEDVE